MALDELYRLAEIMAEKMVRCFSLHVDVVGNGRVRHELVDYVRRVLFCWDGKFLFMVVRVMISFAGRSRRLRDVG